ncbi:MAG: hypothetical protein U0694_09160 [Anaerolineae bacterium]
MSEQDAKQMLREGIEAAREGDRTKARELFEKVVEKEENNEKAWLWLASVMDTDEERRMCFANVLQIDPDNERAQKEMAKIEARMNKTKADEEVVPGISRRQLTTYIGIAAVIVVIVFALVAIIGVARNAQEAAAAAEFTAVAQRATDVVSTQIAQDAANTATQAAAVSPTPSPTETSAAPTLPPTWTSIPTESGPAALAALPQPVGLPGFIVGWQGRDFSGRGFYQAVYYPLDASGAFTPIVDSARDVTINPVDCMRVVYTGPFSAGSTFGILAINLNGSQPEELPLRWQGTTEQIIEQQMPSFSRDGSKVAFVSRAADTNTRQIYILDMNAAAGAGAITRFTNDPGDYTYPVFSPDGTRIAAVRSDVNGAQAGEDVLIFDALSRATLAQVTNNLGDYIESHLAWVNDTQIAYAFAPGNDPDTHDIAISPADASGAPPLLPARDPVADDSYPVFSSDGAYMVFSSNRSGQYDIYVFDIAGNQLFQLTNTAEPDYPGAWCVPQ